RRSNVRKNPIILPFYFLTSRLLPDNPDSAPCAHIHRLALSSDDTTSAKNHRGSFSRDKSASARSSRRRAHRAPCGGQYAVGGAPPLSSVYHFLFKIQKVIAMISAQIIKTRTIPHHSNSSTVTYFRFERSEAVERFERLELI